MLDIKLIVTNDQELRQMPRVIEQIIKELAGETELIMTDAAPYKSGALSGSVRPDYVRPMSAMVSPHKIYARVQNYGWPPPHTMRGSFRGHHYIEKTVETLESRAQNIVDTILNSHFGGS